MANPKLVVEIIANTQTLLKNLEAGRGAIEAYGPTIAKMQDTWARNSAQVIEKAALVTASMKDIAAGTLTAADASKNLRTLETAMAQLRAAGQPIPPLMAETAASLKKVVTEATPHPSLFDRIKTSLVSLGPVILATFSVTAIVAAGKKVLNYAGHISDLSDKLGVSTDTVQRWEAVFGKSGVALDTVSRSASELANRVFGGDKSTTAALEKMGLKVNDLKKLDMEQMFYVVGDAVGQLQNKGEQIYASKTLFGKGGVDLLAALDGKLQETAARMDELGLVIDTKTIKAADSFGDQLGFMGKQLLAVVGTVMGPLLPALSMLGTALMWLGNNVIGPILGGAVKTFLSGIELLWVGIAEFIAKLGDLAQKIPIVGKHLGGLTQATDWLRDSSARTTAHIQGMWQQTDKAGESAKKATGPLLGLGGASEEAAKAAKEAAKRQEAWNESVAKATEKIREHLPYMVRGLQGYQGLRAGIDDVLSSSLNAAGATDVMSAAMQHLYVLHPPLLDVEKKQVDTLGDLSQAFTQLAQASDGSMSHLARWTGTVLNASKAGREAVQSFKAIGDTQGSGTERMVGYAVSTLGAVAALDQATASGSTLERTLGGVTTGAAIGSAILPGIGTAVGAVTGAIVGFARGLAGVSEEVEEARVEVDKFQKSIYESLTATQKAEAGGVQWKGTVIGIRDAYLTLGYTIPQAEAAATALWQSSEAGGEAAQTTINNLTLVFEAAEEQVKRVTAAIDSIGTAASAAYGVITPAMKTAIEQARELNGLTDEQKAALDRLLSSGPDYAALTKVAEGYGISLENMGVQFRQADLSTTALKYASDMEAMQAAGMDVNGMLVGMADEVQGVLDTAWRFGGEIPAAMRPFVDQMIAGGLLTDALGNRLETTAGITFAETDPLPTSLNNLNQTIQNLIATLGGVPGAINAINRTTLEDKRARFVYTVTTEGGGGIEPEPSYGALGGLATARGIVYAAAGRILPFVPRGTDTVPAMLTPGEGVLSVKDMQALGGAAGFSALRHDLRAGGRGQVYDFSTMKAEIVALRRDLSRQNRQLPHLLAVALQNLAARR